jgi:hypothetical protein
MKPCKNCHHSISTSAKACPQCGHPNTPESSMTVGSYFFYLAITIIIFIYFESSSDSSSTSTSTSTQRSQQGDDNLYIEVQKEKIQNRLKDPASAEFKNTFVSRKMGSPIVCGQINSKNSFGAFSGFQRFISGGEIQVLESDMAPGEMETTWFKVCGNH